MDKTEKAVSSFKEGLNCSQAILTAWQGELGLDVDAARNIASAFGGGIGCTGETCGAITGALMVLGLKYGSADKGRKVSEKTRKFLDAFTERFGSARCKALLECDISTTGGMKRARAENLFKEVCPGFVRAAAEILEGL